MNEEHILKETLQLLAKINNHLPKAEQYKVDIIKRNILNLFEKESNGIFISNEVASELLESLEIVSEEYNIINSFKPTKVDLYNILRKALGGK